LFLSGCRFTIFYWWDYFTKGIF